MMDGFSITIDVVKDWAYNMMQRQHQEQRFGDMEVKEINPHAGAETEDIDEAKAAFTIRYSTTIWTFHVRSSLLIFDLSIKISSSSKSTQEIQQEMQQEI
jgi:hypothetical protein